VNKRVGVAAGAIRTATELATQPPEIPPDRPALFAGQIVKRVVDRMQQILIAPGIATFVSPAQAPALIVVDRQGLIHKARPA
jgi:hypothetical protein